MSETTPQPTDNDYPCGSCINEYLCGYYGRSCGYEGTKSEAKTTTKKDGSQ